MTRPAALLRLLAASMLALAAAGCLPKIGDPCSSSLDCSQRGERLCDTTQQNGYCTIFNCEPDSCPDNATCLAFNHTVDPACSSTNDGSWPRFERTFCVWPCNENADCRDGYECVEVAGREETLVLDKQNPREKVCLQALPSQSGGDTGTDGLPAVCEPGDPGTLPDPYEPPVGTGGAGGSGGAGGASGSGGTGGGP